MHAITARRKVSDTTKMFLVRWNFCSLLLSEIVSSLKMLFFFSFSFQNSSAVSWDDNWISIYLWIFIYTKCLKAVPFGGVSCYKTSTVFHNVLWSKCILSEFRVELHEQCCVRVCCSAIVSVWLLRGI